MAIDNDIFVTAKLTEMNTLQPNLKLNILNQKKEIQSNHGYQEDDESNLVEQTPTKAKLRNTLNILKWIYITLFWQFLKIIWV